MKRFLIEWKIKRLYKRGNKLLERLDFVVWEHAKYRQEADIIDEGDSIMSAYEHALKSDLYGINAQLCNIGKKYGRKCKLFDFEEMDYSGLVAA